MAFQRAESISQCSACRHLVEAIMFEDFENQNVWKSTTKSWTSSWGEHRFTTYSFRGHHERLRLIRQSAQQCDMCNLIVDHWPVKVEEEEEDQKYWIYGQPISSGDPTCTMSFLVCSNQERQFEEEGQRFEIFHRQTPATPDVDENAKDKPSFMNIFGSRRYSRIRRETHAYSGSDECFELATKWIAECSNTHTRCAQPEERFMPKRLLDTKSEDSQRSIRLCESHVTYEPYVALSHCWGGRVSLRTTESNRSAHLQKIPWHEVPNTFRDAITIVQKLGYRYIWIDALCIIQDSEADWKQEAAVMDKVYAEAALTISSTDSANSWSGIFANRKPQRSVPLPLLSLPGFQEHNLHICPLEVSEDVYEHLKESVLNSRAWTLQERLLSRANLHFTNKALVWECRTHTRTEDGHTSTSHPLFKHVGNYYTPAVDDPILSWYIIVQEYTKRQLTYDSDKLEALGGLAKHFSKVSGVAGYSFGMWDTDFPRALLWEREIESLENLAHCVPSWSWASRRGRIGYALGCFSKPHIKSDFDLHVHVWSTTRALSGHLLVEGYLQEAFYDRKTQEISYEIRIGFNCKVHFRMDSADFEGYCWFLYVGAWMYSETDLTDLSARFLVLEQQSTDNGGLFKRVGTATFSLNDGTVLNFGKKLMIMMENWRRIQITLI